jgi:peptidyl-prolyl cis-trans isomerase D
VVDAVLRADAQKLPAVVGVELGDQGYVVARIDAVLPREAGDDVAMRQQYGQAWSGAETRAYFDALKARFKADVKTENLAAASSEPGR